MSEPTLRNSRLTRVHVWTLLLFGVGAIFAGELSARVEDRLREDISFFASPDHDRDLIIRDEFGTRGRPNGAFQKWKLNSQGFRGPEVQLEPRPGCTRIAVLGASETFGLYEDDGMEYSAQLRKLLGANRCVEVVNTSIVGMTLPSMSQYWRLWVSRFRPDVAVIYPTPAFYLADRLPVAAPPRASAPAEPAGARVSARLMDRARNLIEFPAFIQRLRDERQIASIRNAHGPEWVYSEVPADRLEAFRKDLVALVTMIQSDGARPVLLTHAVGFSLPLDSQEDDALLSWQRISPRAAGTVLLQFEAATAAVTIEVGRELRLTVVDLSRDLGGQKDLFGADLIHFSNKGATRVAERIASQLAR